MAVQSLTSEIGEVNDELSVENDTSIVCTGESASGVDSGRIALLANAAALAEHQTSSRLFANPGLVPP
jgi:hypothetical protein